MNTTAPSLLCLELKSIAIGYRVLKMITERNEIRVLEAAPAGDRFVILVKGSHAHLDEASTRAREAIDASEAELLIDQELVAACDPTVADALYHLPQVEAAEAIIVVECATVSGLVAIAQSLVHVHGLKVIELKLKRSGGGGYGFFTGDTKTCAPAAEEARTKLKRSLRDGRIEVIDEMTMGFRSFFNLSGLT